MGAGRGRPPRRGEDGVRPQGPPQSGEEAIARPRVHVTGSVPAVVTEALEQDFELVPEAAGADGVLALLTTKVDGDYLDGAGSQLAIVANYAVGVDNVDLDAARDRGVQIANTPDVLTKATAELAIALTLALLRRVAEGDRFIRERTTWTFSLPFMLGEGLDGKTFAVVGPGRIGREAARLAEAFGARLVFAGRGDDLHAVLATADVVSVHCPLTEATHHLIDADAFAAMQPTAVLVNTARGPIVDEAALVAALSAGSSPAPRSTSSSTSRREREATHDGERRPDAAHRQRDPEHARGDGAAGRLRTPRGPPPRPPPGERGGLT